MLKQIKKNIVPYLVIFSFNWFLLLVFQNSEIKTISFDLLVLVSVIYFLSTKLKNIFNKIIVYTWIVFFFLGIFNVTSIEQQRNSYWNLNIYEPSLLYLTCLLVFVISLLLFEKIKVKKVRFTDDTGIIYSSPFGILVLIYPLLFFVNVFSSLGFLPILLGENFVDDMYGYNYGFFYSYKFMTVYGFCLTFLLLRLEYWSKYGIIYLLFLLFVVSIDGKRFVLLVCLLSMLPLLLSLQKSKVSNQIKLGSNTKNVNTTVLFLIFGAVGFVYFTINMVRTGGDISEATTLLVEKIPFGVEYKDFVHSYNTYTPKTIKNYNFELSAFGSFFNSTFLELFNFKKQELYQLGSQHAWMSLYNEKFGIRLGIIAELYFAYGLVVIPLMSLIAFFTSRITARLSQPKSYFNLIQYSILFSLIILLINGQATVFFGCLTMVMYMFFVYIFASLFPIRLWKVN